MHWLLIKHEVSACVPEIFQFIACEIKQTGKQGGTVLSQYFIINRYWLKLRKADVMHKITRFECPLCFFVNHTAAPNRATSIRYLIPMTQKPHAVTLKRTAALVWMFYRLTPFTNPKKELLHVRIQIVRKKKILCLFINTFLHIDGKAFESKERCEARMVISNCKCRESVA